MSDERRNGVSEKSGKERGKRKLAPEHIAYAVLGVFVVIIVVLVAVLIAGSGASGGSGTPGTVLPCCP